MKIVCGSCGAKYSIADEKVRGKVFKIRCKKCSEVIVVKGTADDDAQEAVADDASYGSAYGNTGGASEWYVVIDGEQAGPITPEEVEAYFTAGQLSSESFVWREGLGDWVMLNSLDEFAHLTDDDGAGPDERTMVASHPDSVLPAAAAAEESSGYPDDATAVIQSDKFREQFEEHQAMQNAYGGDAGYAEPQAAQDPYAGSDPYRAADPYAAQDSYESGPQGALQSGYGEPAAAAPSYESAPVSGGYDSAPASSGYDGFGGDDDYDSGGGGMFAAFDAGAPDHSESDYGGSSSSYDDHSGGGLSVSGANDMVGARNENSVLFSLSSLDQVQAVSKPAANEPGAGPANDKSGLIDIQALASAHASMKSSGGSAADSGAMEAFGGTMNMPALMPMGSHRNSNKGLMIALGVGGFVLLVVVLGVGFMILNKETTTTVVEQTIAQETGPSEEAKAALAAKEAEEAKEAAAAAEAALAAKEAKEEPEEKVDEKDEKEASDRKVADRKTTTSTTKSDRKTETVAAVKRSDPPPRTKTTKTKSDGIDDIIGQLDGKKSATKSEPAAAKNLPPALTRPMVQNTVRQNNSRIHQCSQNSNKDGLSGTVTVRFTVEPNGSVSAAAVQGGQFRGTDVGSCIEGVVRKMKFPATEKDLTINYPFILR